MINSEFSFEKNTAAKLRDVDSDKNIVILRKKYGENKEWIIVTAEDAFTDILYSDRWGVDVKIEESDSLFRFLEKCDGNINWRKTEKFCYKFLNIENLQRNEDFE